MKTIKKYRQAGLDLNGEFGPENLAFKALRTQGIIKRLYEKLDELHSERLSLPENKVIRKVIKLYDMCKDEGVNPLMDKINKRVDGKCIVNPKLYDELVVKSNRKYTVKK